MELFFLYLALAALTLSSIKLIHEALRYVNYYRTVPELRALIVASGREPYFNFAKPGLIWVIALCYVLAFKASS